MIIAKLLLALLSGVFEIRVLTLSTECSWLMITAHSKILNLINCHWRLDLLEVNAFSAWTPWWYIPEGKIHLE